MADLISRAATLERMKSMAGCATCDNYNGVRCRACIWDDAMNIVDEVPSVDAVPVIRCRDCEHFMDMSGTSYPSYCYKHTTFDADGEFDNVFSVEPDKYCAWGERRGENA